MSSSIYILRENAGFTLYCEDGGRLEVESNLITEDYAISMFSKILNTPTTMVIPFEEIPFDVVFEGIETIAVKNGTNVSYKKVKDVFSSAINVMMAEANEQEMVFGDIPILSSSGNWFKDDFERFFLTQLKSTKHKPEKYCFPEFSIANPILASTAKIGEASERIWGVIQDRKQLIEIKDQIVSSLLYYFGNLPSKKFVENYYLAI